VLGLSTEKRLKPRAAALAATLQRAATTAEEERGKEEGRGGENRRDCEPISADARSSTSEAIDDVDAMRSQEPSLSAEASASQHEDVEVGQTDALLLLPTISTTVRPIEGIDMQELISGDTKVPLHLFLEGAPLALEKFLQWLPSAPLRASAAAAAAAADEAGSVFPGKRVRVTRTTTKKKKTTSSPNLHTLKWEAAFKKLGAFREVHGHCDVGASSSLSSSSTSFGSHDREERSQFGHADFGNVAESEINGFDNSGSGSGNVSASEDLKKWVTRQRWLRRNGSLKPEREGALDGLGFVWEKGSLAS